jgi:hypothetical protein
VGISGRSDTVFVTYYIKDVALIDSAGAKLYADGNSVPFGSTTLGQLSCQLTGVVTQRSMEPEPSAP